MGRCSKPVALVISRDNESGRSEASATGECEHSDRSSAKRDSNMHAASKTTTAFLKATNTETISHGIPEDDMTAAVVEAPPLLTRHSPIPLELAEASAMSQLQNWSTPSEKLCTPLCVVISTSR
jgi:hypothetical protein